MDDKYEETLYISGTCLSKYQMSKKILQIETSEEFIQT
jgi:hypothetical protein